MKPGTLLAALLALAPAAPAAAQSESFSFRCDGGAAVRVAYIADGAVALLAVDGTIHVLTRARSASGARYEGPAEPGGDSDARPAGEVGFWTKGGEALLDIPDQPRRRCRAE